MENFTNKQASDILKCALEESTMAAAAGGSSARPILGYWDARGRAGPIRLLLAYLGVDYEDKRYKMGPNHDNAEWSKEKFTLGLDFPNLPYLIDGDVKLTQSVAILRYLGAKYNLAGSTENDQVRIDLFEQQLQDILNFFIRFVHNKEFSEDQKEEFLTRIEAGIEAVGQFIGSSGYAVGGNLTYVDFWLYEVLYNLEKAEVTRELIRKRANLVGYLKRIEGLPEIAEYLKKVNV